MVRAALAFAMENVFESRGDGDGRGVENMHSTVFESPPPYPHTHIHVLLICLTINNPKAIPPM
jgi:hypothetical protein